MGLIETSTIYLSLLSFLYLGQVHSEPATDGQNLTISIPTAGNSWVINDVSKSSKVISSKGISNWSDPDHVIRTYFYVKQPGKIYIGINGKVRSGTSVIKVSFKHNSKDLSLTNTELKEINIGEFTINTAGYHFIDIEGLQKDDAVFADIKDVLLGNDANSNFVNYVKDDFHFGRRGPSTHLIFDNPPGIEDIEWFYNEIEIADGNDVIGSYYMANGCRQGYFGIQVNSPRERRILFSIWSPYRTDDPSKIPADQRITMLKKGENVNTGKFGNEGSGGQSYKVYNWKTNTRYRFLLGAKPTGNNSTIYSAYFYDPEVGIWDLIAKFERPKTDTHLQGLYSFLENFVPNTGAIERKGGFYNQWVRDARGNWHEITEARFSADATAKKDARLDYSGGVNKHGFYLKNCGFTNDKVDIGVNLVREKSKAAPSIDFSSLE